MKRLKMLAFLFLALPAPKWESSLVEAMQSIDHISAKILTTFLCSRQLVTQRRYWQIEFPMYMIFEDRV